MAKVVPCVATNEHMTEVSAGDLLLRGTVGGVLLFHLVNLLGRGPRPAARAALWLFTLSLLA